MIGLLLLGAAINVAVAWGCAMYAVGDEIMYLSADDSHWRDPAHWTPAERRWRSMLPARVEAHEVERIQELLGFGLRRTEFHTPRREWLEISIFGSMGEAKFARLLVGWPDFALSCDQFLDEQSADPVAGAPYRYFHALIIETDSTYWPPSYRVFPYWPTFPGFAINTLFYAAICWGLFAIPVALRRRRRINRGLCPSCAYPIGASEVCTECGRALGHRRINCI